MNFTKSKFYLQKLSWQNHNEVKKLLDLQILPQTAPNHRLIQQVDGLIQPQ